MEANMRDSLLKKCGFILVPAVLIAGLVLFLSAGASVKEPASENSLAEMPADGDALPAPMPSAGGLTPRDFMPFQERSYFHYNGFLCYGVRMELQSLRSEKKGTRILARATVEDLSDGEAGQPPEYFAVNLEYFATPASLVQSGMRRPLLDSNFRSIELLRAPIEKGAHWQQKQRDAAGKLAIIDSRITNVITQNGRTLVDVTYASRDGSHYEVRTFESGKGLVGYLQRMVWDDGEEMLGFTLFREEWLE
jgi:hypothetical protein